MFDPIKHKIVLINLLKDIYSDVELRTILGFKGGTAAMMFYDLPRLSVDLDFDLLREDKKELVLEKIKKILQPYGEIHDVAEKRFTLFFLLSYEKGKQAVKIEISKRKGPNVYEFKNCNFTKPGTLEWYILFGKLRRNFNKIWPPKKRKL